MKVVFLGTPDFGIPTLEKLFLSEHEITAIVTQPDKINARNNQVILSPVKKFALEHSIPVYQFQNISRDGMEILKNLNPDIMVTAAYGQILSNAVLDIAKYGVINIHASILPRYRGSSPIQAALLNGDTEIGVTIMQTVEKVDAGAIIKIKKIELQGEETAEDCFNLLSQLGAEALLESLDEIDEGRAIYIEQDESLATYTSKIKKEDGRIIFNKRVKDIINQIRAFTPWPGAYTFTSKDRLIVHKARVFDDTLLGNIGEVLVADKKLIIQAKDGTVELEIVQGEGRQKMPADSYLRGKPIELGFVFS